MPFEWPYFDVVEPFGCCFSEIAKNFLLSFRIVPWKSIWANSFLWNDDCLTEIFFFAPAKYPLP